MVLSTQHSLSAADLQFNLSKKETIRSKRQIGLEELRNAVNQGLFVTLIVKEEGGNSAQRRELSLSHREKRVNKAEETNSLSPVKKTDPVLPVKPLEMHKTTAIKTVNPLLTRKTFDSSPIKPIKSRESSQNSSSIIDNLKLIAAIALKLAKSPDKSDTKSQVSDTFSSISSESPRKTDNLSMKRALPAIYESVHESTPPHMSRTRGLDPFRARFVRSVAFSSPTNDHFPTNEHSPDPNFSTSLSAPRSPGKALDPRTTANPILRHFGRMYGIKDSFWTDRKLGKGKKTEERGGEEEELGRREGTPVSSMSFRTYDLAHISFDRALNSRGFSPFRCTKRDTPSSLSHRPPSLY